MDLTMEFKYLRLLRTGLLLLTAFLVFNGCSETRNASHGMTVEIQKPIGTYNSGTSPGKEQFPEKVSNATVNVAENPVSTFSIDVDKSSYAFVRRALNENRLPPKQAVRAEEMINYFPYAYPAPNNRSKPFQLTTSVLPCPWASDNQLLHIALRGYDIVRNDRPRTNIVLLVDTSGSMQSSDRLPLLKQGFRLFLQQLRSDDYVSIVTYAGEAKIALEPTSGEDRERILNSIDRLEAGGSTAGAEGLQRAYTLAEKHFDRDAVNRIILATDGDFNVGVSDPNELEKLIADKRKTGIYLSIFGVGVGNFNDKLTQRLAQAGNGNAVYIDSLHEARKALSEELASTLFPIADDVKVQVEFNPARVASYRLIGYETRMLRREDFKNDKIDAGDIGAGHTVTAIYEITPVHAANIQMDPLRYQTAQKTETNHKQDGAEELAFIKLRYKIPGEAASQLMDHPVLASSVLNSFSASSTEQQFSVAVAAFAQKLSGQSALTDFHYSDIIALANSARGPDSEGYRAEFVHLVRQAETIESVQQP